MIADLDVVDTISHVGHDSGCLVTRTPIHFIKNPSSIDSFRRWPKP